MMGADIPAEARADIDAIANEIAAIARSRFEAKKRGELDLRGPLEKWGDYVAVFDAHKCGTRWLNKFPQLADGINAAIDGVCEEYTC